MDQRAFLNEVIARNGTKLFGGAYLSKYDVENCNRMIDQAAAELAEMDGKA